MRESGAPTLVHGKAAGSENNCGYLRVLPTQPGAKVGRQISAGPLISVSLKIEKHSLQMRLCFLYVLINV